MYTEPTHTHHTYIHRVHTHTHYTYIPRVCTYSTHIPITHSTHIYHTPITQTSHTYIQSTYTYLSHMNRVHTQSTLLYTECTHTSHTHLSHTLHTPNSALVLSGSLITSPGKSEQLCSLLVPLIRRLALASHEAWLHLLAQFSWDPWACSLFDIT